MKERNLIRWLDVFPVTKFEAYLCSFSVLLVSLIIAELGTVLMTVIIGSGDNSLFNYDVILPFVVIVLVGTFWMLKYSKTFYETIFPESGFVVFRNKNNDEWKFDLSNKKNFRVKLKYFGLVKILNLEGERKPFRLMVTSKFKKRVLKHLNSLLDKERYDQTSEFFKSL